MNYIMIALGWVLDMIYRLIGNYGFAIILFTVLIKLALYPLDLKQRRSMAKTQKIQPLLMEVQKKYGNDKEKLNRETMKLYQKYGISPTSGCLPMLIQLPIIFALYWVVRKPIAYMIGVSFADMWRVATAYNNWAAANPSLVPATLLDKAGEIIVMTFNGKNGADNLFGTYEIQIAQVMFQHPEILSDPVMNGVITPDRLIDFGFFGLDLSQQPSLNKFFGIFIGKLSEVDLNTALLWLIPLFSGLSSWISTRLTSTVPKKDKKAILSEEEKKAQSNTNQNDTMRTMTTIMPLISTWFTFTLPSAVGIYWITSNIIQIVQHKLVSKRLADDISNEEIEGEIKNVKSNKKRKKH